MFQRVAIIGLGLIGGSIGLALRKANAAKEIRGYDLGRGVCEQARRIGAIDQAYEALADAVRGAELVILATPVGAVRALLENIAPALAPGAIVTDVASTKAQVIQWAEEQLPENVAFVGGHPMAGKELSGVEAADATLFRNRIYCLTPTAQTRPGAVSKVCTLVEILEARVRFLDAAEHDRLVAGVSHLPFLASVALMNTLVEDETWSEASPLAANGFRDATRLAAGSPEMYRDICLTNREAIVQWLDRYIASLYTLREQVDGQEREIDEVFTRAREARLRWQASQGMEE
jgi:prephenate dehydrogenase